jgi:hypothetical protein
VIAQSVATGCGVRFPGGGIDFSLFHSEQTGSEGHSALYPMAAGGSFPGDKVAGALI